MRVGGACGITLVSVLVTSVTWSLTALHTPYKSPDVQIGWFHDTFIPLLPDPPIPVITF